MTATELARSIGASHNNFHQLLRGGQAVGKIIYVNVDGIGLDVDGWLIDGQQRLSAIRDFLEDKVEIFNNVKWSDIKDGIKFAPGLFEYIKTDRDGKRTKHQTTPLIHWKGLIIHAIRIYETDKVKLAMLYERLNYGGTVHTQDDRHRVQDFINKEA